MNELQKTFWTIVGLVLSMLALVWVVSTGLKLDECEERGGVLVFTGSGNLCLEVKEK